MSQPRNNNQNKQYTKDWNNKKRDFRPKKEEHYLDAYKPGIEVWNGDVNKALRILKKRLEKADFQKELAKQQFYEKPSAKRKRKKDAAIKRTRKAEDLQISKGEWMPHTGDNLKSMKGKREKRKAFMQKQRIKRLTGRRLK